MIRETKCLDVPHLRFPEFSGEWKKCKLGDLCNVLMCKRILVSQTNTEDGVPFYKIGTIGSTPDAYISKELFDDYKVKYNYPRKGEVMITCAGTVGKCVVYDGEDAYFQDSNIVWIDNPTQYISNGFLFHLLSKVDWRKLNSTTIIRIYNDDLRNLKMSYPRKEEQQKISHLLSLLDERIATQNKIIEKLQSLIKGLAVALTTKEKANIAISQCLECHSSTLQESEVLSSGLCKVFGANGLVGYKDVPQMNGDAILVIKDGSGVGTVSYAQGKFSVIGTLNYLTVIGNNDLRYLYFALSVFNFQPYKTGMAIPHIYFKDYGKAKIYCPSLAEQKRVANVLDKLESKLFVEQELLASFNQQKLYLLGKMFI
ncbi:restriction endonuclease subunit S [Bacteroides ovatus]|nr:restriction endonuclease subunit S [Bacteroides ovatus]KAB3709252.1 restriction endonuclease subunit S [Phocaeicola vulgatus]KAA4565856.1 restriction endonuclease subunit S [Bacteroides ovatus]KAA4583048.1 restriction endonuclease subunit S [Bacteroides ovatus]KAA4598653.1 restriction endonuclease subunit S [Bacteroides ovatus]